MADSASPPEAAAVGANREGHDRRTDALSLRLRLGAKAAVTSRDRVLLVQERRSDGTTFWTLPGGGACENESLRACLRREVAEELQCRATVGEPLTACLYRHTSRPRTVTAYTVFATEIEGTPVPAEGEGIVDHAWVRPTDPPDSTLPPMERALRDVVAESPGDR